MHNMRVGILYALAALGSASIHPQLAAPPMDVDLRPQPERRSGAAQQKRASKKRRNKRKSG